MDGTSVSVSTVKEELKTAELRDHTTIHNSTSDTTWKNTNARNLRPDTENERFFQLNRKKKTGDEVLNPIGKVENALR